MMRSGKLANEPASSHTGASTTALPRLPPAARTQPTTNDSSPSPTRATLADASRKGRRSPGVGSGRNFLPARMPPLSAGTLRVASAAGARPGDLSQMADVPVFSPMAAAPPRRSPPPGAVSPAKPSGSTTPTARPPASVAKPPNPVNPDPKASPQAPRGVGNNITPMEVPTVTVIHGKDSNGNSVDYGSAFLNSSEESTNTGKGKKPATTVVPTSMEVGDDDDVISIISVETPSGLDSNSSSSDSAGFANSGSNKNNNNNNVSNFSGAAFSFGGAHDDELTPNTPHLAAAPLRSFDDGDNLFDDYDMHSHGGGFPGSGVGAGFGYDYEDGIDRGSNTTGCSGVGGMMGGGAGAASGSPGMTEENSHNGLATFMNRPKECHHCQSSAVGYACELCTSFYLCEDCRFNESVLADHDLAHRIIPLHETHCNTSRTFGASSSFGTVECTSTLFYDPCSLCHKGIDDAEPVYRCEVCDFIVCESCRNTRKVEHPHELRRFQRKTRNSSVTEGALVNKSRTNDGNRIINDYVVVRLLGRGSFAKVKLVQNIRTRNLYALKILRKTRRSQSNLLSRSRARQNDDDLLREIAVMKFVDHANIVKLAEVIDDVDGGKVYVIMEYCSKGPVHVLGDPVLSTTTTREYGLGILSGLLHLHHEFLYHRDVKPANCLVNEQNVVKIADFGTCNSRIRTNSVDGTPAFACPEQACGKEASGDVADSWAYALTLYQMAYGLLPCDGMGALQYREFLGSDEPIPVPPLEALEDPNATESVHNADLTDLLKRMLNKDLAQRMLLVEAARHPFFKLDSAAVKRLCGSTASLEASTLGPRRLRVGGGPSEPAARPGAGKHSSPSANGGRRHTTPVTLSPTKLSSVAAAAGNRNSVDGANTVVDPFPPSSYRPHSGTGGGGGNIGFGFHGWRRSAASNSGSDTNQNSGVLPVSGRGRNAQLLEEALHEVRRGKNLTEAFHGVKSLRRVRRKDVKNADNNLDRDDASSAGHPGNSQSFADDTGTPNALDGAPSPNSRSGSSFGPRTPRKSTRSQQVGGVSLTGGHSGSERHANRGNYSPLNSSLSGAGFADNNQRRLSQPLQSDSAFDMAAIMDCISQQLSDKSSSLDLVRLKMHAVPMEVNKVAKITTSLRFSANSLLSVASVQFPLFTFLKDITITSNQLKRFPEEVLAAPRLLRLDLSHNNITSVPPSVASARFLERLNLHANNIRSVGADARTHTSVLAGPSLRHVRLSSNPMETLPQDLESTRGIELVLDANPAVMKEWYATVDKNISLGLPPPAVVIWDDYFPVRIPGCVYDVWVASGDLSLYRAHTLKACDTPFVVLLSGTDPRFPSLGAMTSQQLTVHLDAEAARQRTAAGEYAIPLPPPRPLPAIVSAESRAFVKSFFFVSDATDDAYHYNDLLDFLLSALVQQKEAFAQKGVIIDEDAAAVVPVADNANNMLLSNGKNRSTDGTPATLTTPTSSTQKRNGGGGSAPAEDGASDGLRPNSGKGLMLVLTNSSAVRDAREFAVAALSDALCKMSKDDSEEQLKVMFDAVMEAMRSLYA